MRNWSVSQKAEGRLVGFLTIAFFLFMADAILSDWIPGFIQDLVHKPVLMGIIISFSSIVGLIMDFIFSEVLNGSRLKKLVWWTVLGIGLFISSLSITLMKSWVWLLIVAMASWGFYYDLFNFFSQQFVVENIARPLRTSAWGVIGFTRNLAYFMGPILGTGLLAKGDKWVLVGAGVFMVVGGILLSLIPLEKREKESDFEHRKIGIKMEFEHWVVLFERVWPLLVVSFLLNIIDATYWTTGTIVSDQLAKTNWWGSMFLPFYILPSLVVGGVIAKLRIEKGKKKLALRFLLGAGFLLSLLEVVQKLSWKLGIVLVSSTLLAVSWPLVNAVYSDLVERMGRERETLLGLADSMMNIAYVIGPIIAGLIAGWVGEEKTFVVIGWLVMIVSGGLMIVMPEKLRLPQKKIHTWD